jgi:hypothetical protein
MMPQRTGVSSILPSPLSPLSDDKGERERDPPCGYLGELR